MNPSTKISILEACQILFKGQSNIKLMANEVGLELEEMQRIFREYVAKNPIDESVWQGDIELSWPYIT